MRYPGGKGKCYQHIINLMPPHETYIESHIGGGSVMRNKLPAYRNIGIDSNPEVIKKLKSVLPDYYELITNDAIFFLRSYNFSGNELIYTDPPYMKSTRRKEYIYKHDYQLKDHEQLLTTLLKLPCMVIISGYDSELYNDLLTSWNKTTFNAKTHNGIRQECLWFNFSPPNKLHDFQFYGQNYRERQNAKRRLDRLKQKVSQMPPIERNEFIEWTKETFTQGA